MRSWAPARRVVRLHPSAVDAVGAAALFALTVAEPVVGTPGARVPAELTPAGVAAGAVMCLAVALRRRWPLPVLVVVVGGAVLSFAVGGGPNPAILAVVAAVYTVASTTTRTTAVLAGAGTALALVATAVATYRIGVLDPETLVLAAWTGMATAVGIAVRNRRAYVAAVEERARRAERTREEEARRRVVEDRLRIARELHDVMAHHIAVINVQAGVAGHVLRADPAAAEEALAHVRRASRSVLDELGAVLDVLRQPDDAEAPTEPTPGLARLQDLVDGFQAAGLAVTWRVSGRPAPLPAAVDLAAYRLVQEALTNAHKHGDGTAARVDLSYTAGRLAVDVANPVPGPVPAGDGTGYGLLGMRERVTAVGGTVRAAAEGAEFRVRAVLPIQEDT